MRIIGGRHRGAQLADVGKGDAEAHLRPTSDRVRENLFNILTSGRLGNVVQDAVVLDLFAGTGALGLEALSRGALVLGSDAGGLAEILRDGETALVFPAGDAAALRARLLEVWQARSGPDPQMGIDLARAQSACSRRFGMEAHMDRLIGHLNDWAGGS